MTNKEPIKNSAFRIQSQKQLFWIIEIFLRSKSKTSRKKLKNLNFQKWSNLKATVFATSTAGDNQSGVSDNAM